MEIGKMTIGTVKMLVNELIDVHAEEIGKAFLKSGDDGVSVSLSVKIGVSKTITNGLDVDATISFVAEKVKEKIGKTVSEDQVELPLADKVYKLAK